MNHQRQILRQQRQEKRMQEITPAMMQADTATCKNYIIFGCRRKGTLEERLAFVRGGLKPKLSSRELRHRRVAELRAAVKEKLEKKSKGAPVSFSAVRRLATEITRRAGRNVTRKGVM